MNNQRVGLMIGTDGVYARQVLAGIRRFLNETGLNWFFAMAPHKHPGLDLLASWHLRGIIATCQSLEIVRKLVSLRVPVVNVGSRIEPPILPHVSNDENAIGRIGAEHFLERRFRRFAFVGWSHLGFSVLRRAGFEAAVQAAGYGCDYYEDKPGSHISRLTNSLSNHNRLCAWLARLTTPIAIMACNDVRGSQVLALARKLAGPYLKKSLFWAWTTTIPGARWPIRRCRAWLSPPKELATWRHSS